MTKMMFQSYVDYEDGKMAACETTGIDEIPVNIFIDNADDFPEMQPGPFMIDIIAVGDQIQVFENEAAYMASGSAMAPVSMIPIGTFSPTNDPNFEPSALILYSGRVLEAERHEYAGPDEINCRVLIETLGLTFRLCLSYSGTIEIGNTVRGDAWLFGNIAMPGLSGLDLIADYRANRDAWLPMVDHADRLFPGRSEHGEYNVGWNAGEYEKGRPFFAECWAEDGVTMLTIFVSAQGMEETTAEQLDEHFRRIGFYKAVSEDRGMECLRFKDDAGNEFFSLNLLVGAEDDVFMEGAPILPYSELNALNGGKTEAPPEGADRTVDVRWRKKDYTAKLVFNHLPADESHTEALSRFVDDLQNRPDVVLVVSLSGRDDPQEFRVSFTDRGCYYMELSFPAEDFDGVHPLLLANDRLSLEQVREILAAVLVEMRNTGEITVIEEEFQEITSVVFGMS